MSDPRIQAPYAPLRAIDDEPLPHEGGNVDATRESRLAAVFIDGAPSSVIAVAVVAILLPGYLAYERAVDAGLEPPPSPDLLVGLTLGIGGLLFLAYVVYSAVLVHRYSQTFGKRVMKIRVVRADGTRATFMHLFFLRGGLTVLLSAIPGVGGLFWLVDLLLIFRDSRQCLHDNIADTKVVTAASSEDATLAGSDRTHLRTISF